MKRGKRLSVSLEEQKLAFQIYKDLFQGKNLPSSESNVYKDVSKTLSLRMTPKSLYLSAKRNYARFFGCELERECPVNITSNPSSSDSDANTSMDDEKYKKTESFNVSLQTWQVVRPELVSYKRNDPQKPYVYHHSRKVLPPSKWTNIFTEWIWKNTSNRCIWAFKHNSVTNDYIVKCEGTCKDCSGKITVITNKIRSVVKIDCIFENVDTKLNHSSKKDKLTSYRKKDLTVKLENQYPVVLRNKMLNKAMEDEDIQEPPFIPNLKSFQNMRTKSYHHKILVMALWIMSFTKPYNTIIKSISIVPFFVHYWTDMQVNFYKKISTTIYTVLSIDATGSIFKKVYPPNDPNHLYESKHLFLYVVLLKIKTTSVPLAQMISGSQKLETIYQWLQSWISSMKKPNEFICDDSAALIGAVVKSCTRFITTKDYIKCCFKILDLTEKTLPECFVRLDTSHFVKILYALDCFKFIDKRVKNFYITHLLRIKSCTDYEKVKDIIHQLVIVSLQRFDRNLADGTKNRCEIAKEKLQQEKTCNDNVLESVEKDLEDLSDSIINIEIGDSEKSSFISWFDKTVAEEKVYSELCDNTEYDNIFYLPGFTNSLRKLLPKLPLWSNVMVTFFKKSVNVASSSNIEKYFNLVKKFFIHKNGLTRVDDFIMQHTDFLSGQIKAAQCLYPNVFKKNYKADTISQEGPAVEKTEENEENFYKESVFRKFPTLQENWRNKIEDKKTLSLRDTIRPKKNHNLIDFLPNGNISNSGIKGVVITNTCAFDALLQAIVVACTEYSKLSAKMTSNQSIFSQIVCALRHKDYSVDIFGKRTTFLRPFFKSTFTGTIEMIDCSCNITYILEKVLFNDLSSGTVTKSCTECNHTATRNCCIIPLNILILSDCGLSALADAASEMIEDTECNCTIDKCKGKQITKFKISDDFVFFEVDMELFISDVPDEILLCDNIFVLAAVIEFVPPLLREDSGLGHYKVHCRLKTKIWECYDDMSKKVLHSNMDDKINSHLLMYVKS